MTLNRDEKLLVLGASGLLGSVLCPCLEKDFASIIPHNRNGLNKYSANLNEKKDVANLFKISNPDSVLNLVALADVDKCESPQSAYLGNVQVIENVVEEIFTNYYPDCFLVNISTDHVYDQSGYKKEREVNIGNYYAFSKYSAELPIQKINGCNLRTNFFGKKRGGKDSFTDWLYTKLVENMPIQVFNDVFFNPLCMTTLSVLIGKVIENRSVGVFNVGSRVGMSKAEFAFAFAEELSLPTKLVSPVSINDVDFIQAYRPRDMRMDVSKIEVELGEKMPMLKDEIIKAASEYTR